MQVRGSAFVATASAGRAHIVAHSMGTMLTLESLRQLHARTGDAVADRIGAVVFAAPDIDMDVFTAAIERIGPLARKITVITASNDRALAFSGQIAGGMTRVGAAEKDAIEQLGVRVIDASSQPGEQTGARSCCSGLPCGLCANARMLAALNEGRSEPGWWRHGLTMT
jgi:esterase/lipase superfamily enzyme